MTPLKRPGVTRKALEHAHHSFSFELHGDSFYPTTFCGRDEDGQFSSNLYINDSRHESKWVKNRSVEQPKTVNIINFIKPTCKNMRLYSRF